MDVTKIKRMIGRCTDPVEIAAVKAAAADRIELLRKRERQRRLDELHAEMMTWEPGQMIHCCARGVFLGGNLQRGDALMFYRYQPRKKRLWLRQPGEEEKSRPACWWFDLVAALRYDFKTEPPETSVSEAERRIAGRLGEVLAERTDAE